MVYASFLSTTIQELPLKFRRLYQLLPKNNKVIFIEFLDKKYASTGKQYLAVILNEQAKLLDPTITLKQIDSILRVNYPYMARKQELIDIGFIFPNVTKSQFMRPIAEEAIYKVQNYDFMNTRETINLLQTMFQ